MIKFEKVSREQFCTDFGDKFPNIPLDIAEEIYENIELPVRGTIRSAGYDFCIPFKAVLQPGEELLFPTGIRCQMDENVVLLCVVRSSTGIKKGLHLCNQVGVIDSDYYNADNEGHIMIKLRNTSYKVAELSAGERVVQGIFVNYLTTEDDFTTTERTGGIGSTDK